MILVYHIK